MAQCDWRERRRLVLSQARRVVIKVGSAVLAGARGVDAAVVASLSAQIAALAASGRQVLLVAGDVYRPAAIDQLKVLGSQIGVDRVKV